MTDILILLEGSEDGLNPLSLRAVSAVRGLGGTVAGILVGGSPAALEAARSHVPDLVELIIPGNLVAEAVAPALAELMTLRGCRLLVAAATALSRDVLPRTAALAKASFLSNVRALDSVSEGTRAVLAGKGLVSVRALREVCIAIVEPSAFPVAEILDQQSTVARHEGHEAAGVLSVTRRTLRREGPSLTDAAVVIGVGRGIGVTTSLPEPVATLASLLGAAVGGTRATCDSGLFPGDLQIGQTGRIIAPECYLALGISGAVQHVAGIRGAKVIVALDKNELAPIFETADYGLVGTWETIVPRLVELLRSK